jgi:sirohydrochlorin cobaltochelatase
LATLKHMSERHTNTKQFEPMLTSNDECHRGLLLVGHGTRDERGRAEFHQMADSLRQRLPEVRIEACFLELAEPSIVHGVRQLVAGGVREIVVLPMMLFAAGHVKRDIPLAVSAAMNECNAVLPVQHASHLSCHERVLELASQRFIAAAKSIKHFESRAATLLLVGRGSKDEEAIAEMHRFAAALAERVSVARVHVGFMAMARPSLADALTLAAADPDCRQVIVQPHLLFHGELLEQLKQRMANVAARDMQRDWVVAEHLGPAHEIVDAVVDHYFRARQTASVARVT